MKTFSLYPGERTTISVRTYKDIVSLASQSKNVLDSFSESSATALDELMQMEQGNLESTSSTNAGSSNSFTTNTDSRNSTKSFSAVVGVPNLQPAHVQAAHSPKRTRVRPFDASGQASEAMQRAVKLATITI